MLLPSLESDSMNSHGNTKVRDVADYIFWEDALCKSVLNAPSQKQRKGDTTKQGSATDFIDLVLLTNIQDEKTGSRYEIKLLPDLNLDTVKKYLFDLIEIEAKVKQMPMYYKLKNP